MSENNTEVMTEDVVEEVVEDVVEEVVEEVVGEFAEEEVVAEEAPAETASLAALHAEEDAKNKKLKEIWDKITTWLLIFLMASPFIILIYIFVWFMNK